MASLQPACHRFCFYLLPAFSLKAYSSAVEVLRLANQVSGCDAYRWQVISDDGEPVVSNCGLSVCVDADLAFEREKARGSGFLSVVVVGGGNGALSRNRQLEAWLRESRSRGASLVGVGNGTMVLARAGLAKGRRCAVHWEQYPMFIEQFPEVVATQTAFEQDGELYTCPGGDTPFDLFLSLVGREHGAGVVTRIREKAMTCRIRSAGERQRLPRHSDLHLSHKAVMGVIDQMELSVSDPVPVEKLAASVGLSRRQVERLFQRELGCSPGRYFLELRLERAHLLLLSTRMPVVEIAMACGFVSASHFSKVYREIHGCAPHQTRLPVQRSRHGRAAEPTSPLASIQF
ncbi:GlxA family transcriptional regulator [Mesorhizobium sp.]|uniref:GlxA family transcriptional regulator n=1 Tax=Mesorhizobium sp. TaxID=1871066 RepID=UPI000FE75D3D|nr:GlxA family transcriptional regulator [Mesorhizobium sp.]RWB70001.1 MAG: GlxA family transcriptional regulator [Mesorhizobium sp.]